MKDSTQLDLLNLSSSFSKLLKKRFGKGPESCWAIFNRGRLYISVRNFITPAEEVLIKKQENELAKRFRSSVLSAVVEEFIPTASEVVGIDFKYFFHDWNYSSNTGFILLEQNHSEHERGEDVSNPSHFLKEVEVIGSQLHRRPEKVRKILNSPNICAIEVIGVQTYLESLLYESGNSELLHRHLDEIKCGYIKHLSQLEKVFNQSLEDVFILGDYERNRYVLITVFPKNTF
jgi:uncharacterized protein YbcI